jgi:arsenate reductase
VLALLRERGIEPRIVEYLQTPPDEKALSDVLRKLGLATADLIRQKEYEALNLPDTDDRQTLIARMAARPQIIQRSIVVRGSPARLGEPPENVVDIL